MEVKRFKFQRSGINRVRLRSEPCMMGNILLTSVWLWTRVEVNSECHLIWTGTEISILVASFLKLYFGPSLNNMTIICGH